MYAKLAHIQAADAFLLDLCAAMRLFMCATFYRADAFMRNFVIVLRGRIAGGG